MPDQQEKPQPGTAIPSRRSANDVIMMFAELGLLVCDDTEIIQKKVESQRHRYLRYKNNPDPADRFRADDWFKNVIEILNNRSELIRAVYEMFASLADAVLSAALTANVTMLTPELKDALSQLLRTQCHVDDKLADRFLVEYMQGRSLKKANSLIIQDAELTKSEPSQSVQPNLLRVHISLPILVTVDEYFDSVGNSLKAIAFIYSIFAILISESPKTLASFIIYLRTQADLAALSSSSLHQFLTTVKVEPLQVVSARYGSPASFDLLGLGKILEILRDTVKDLVRWKHDEKMVEHEEEMAKLEQKAKQTENSKARLETEKASLDIIAQKAQIERAKIENEKMLLELATQKLETIQKLVNSQLPENDKRLILSALLPKMVTITNETITPKPITPLLKSQYESPLLPSETTTQL